MHKIPIGTYNTAPVSIPWWLLWKTSARWGKGSKHFIIVWDNVALQLSLFQDPEWLIVHSRIGVTFLLTLLSSPQPHRRLGKYMTTSHMIRCPSWRQWLLDVQKSIRYESGIQRIPFLFCNTRYDLRSN